MKDVKVFEYPNGFRVKLKNKRVLVAKKDNLFLLEFTRFLIKDELMYNVTNRVIEKEKLIYTGLTLTRESAEALYYALGETLKIN